MKGDVPRKSTDPEEAEEVEMGDINTQHEADAAPTAPLLERDHVGTLPKSASNRGPGNAFIWALTVAASVGGLLFGYDTGVISSTLVSIGVDLSARHLTSLDKGLITSATSFFALLASPIAGFLADRLGRRSIIIYADVLFIGGALWQAVTSSVWGMIVGRAIVGLAIGGASMIVPLYIAELAPGHLRGRLTTVQLLFITGGQVVAYLVGWAFSTMPAGWRWMVGLGAFPALTQIAMLAFMPETPRYLAKAGQEEKARQILRKVYKNTTTHLGATADATLAAIKKEIMQEEEAAASLHNSGASSSQILVTIKSLFGHPPHRRALTIACLLQGLQQLCGFNSLMYFSATIFDILHFGNPTLTSLSIALTNFLFTIVAFYTIDRIGRRRSLLFTLPIMVIALVLCAIAFDFMNLPKDALSPPSTEPQNSDKTQSGSRLPAYGVLVALVLYVSPYAAGLGPIPWVQSELFPLSVRSLGSSLSTATNWFCNTIVGLTFLPMMQAITPGWTFVTYAVVCVFGWLAIFFIYPETTGLEIEEVGQLLQDGWGVKKSIERTRTSKGKDVAT